jgi:hypothetical protein
MKSVGSDAKLAAAIIRGCDSSKPAAASKKPAKFWTCWSRPNSRFLARAETGSRNRDRFDCSGPTAAPSQPRTSYRPQAGEPNGKGVRRRGPSTKNQAPRTKPSAPPLLRQH